MKVKITSDSTCDLPAALQEKYNIDVIPLFVCFGEESRKDGVEVTPEDIYHYVEAAGELPKTSAVNVADYCSRFARWTKEGYAVVHFSLSSELSSSYQNACLAAAELENVHIVDSRNLSTGQGLLVLRAAELAAAGKSAEEIVADSLAHIPLVETSFVVESLDYLYKGGRCSALAAFGANLLLLKPCIEVKDGAMEPSKKYRGGIERVIRQYTEDRLIGRTDIDKSRIFLVCTTCGPEVIHTVEQKIRELIPDVGELIKATAGSTITAHCGPNTLGVMFMRTR